MPSQPSRRTAVLGAALGLLLAVPAGAGAAGAGATVSGSGNAAFSGRGLVFSDPDTGVTSGPRTAITAPRRAAFGVRCLDGRPLRRCATVAVAAPGRLRYRLHAPVRIFSIATRFSFAIVASPSFAVTLQACGTLRLRGTGTYTIGTQTVPYAASTTPVVVRLRCSRAQQASILRAARA